MKIAISYSHAAGQNGPFITVLAQYIFKKEKKGKAVS